MSPLTRRQALRLLGIAGVTGVAAPVLAGCGSSGTDTPSDGSPIRAGLLVPRSGASKVLGEELINGFTLYLDLHAGVLSGHRVEVVPADEGESLATAKKSLDGLLGGTGVQVLTGVASAEIMRGLRDQVETAQVPLLGSNGSPFELGSPKYIWRTSYVDNEAGEALGGYLAHNLPAKSQIFVLSDDSASGRDEVTGFLTAYQGVPGHSALAADPVTVPLASNPGASLTRTFNTIEDSKAKAVFAFFTGAGAVAFVKAFRARFGTTIALYAPGFLTEGSLLQQQGGAAAGIFTALNYSCDLDNDANRTFYAAYQKTYGRVPTGYAVASYDAAAVLDKALALAGTDLSSQSINAAIGRVGEIDSPRGTWQFNQKRTPLQKWYLREVRPDGAILGNMLVSDLATLT